MIFNLKAKDAAFTGFMGGADFHDGQGTTSNIGDAAALLEGGLAVIEDADDLAVVIGHIGGQHERKAIGDLQRAAQEEVERRPGYMGTKIEPAAGRDRWRKKINRMIGR